MNKKNFLIVIVIILIGIVIFTFIQNNSEDTKTADTDTTNVDVVKDGDVMLGDGFALTSIPDGWELSSQSDNEINTIKSGSPATIMTIKPVSSDDPFGPTITFSTFTIGEQLTAAEVADLIQERNVATQISNNSEPCLQSADQVESENYDTYEFIENTTGTYDCNYVVTEPAISYTVVFKNQGDSSTLIVMLVTVNQDEYDFYVNDLVDAVRSIN